MATITQTPKKFSVPSSPNDFWEWLLLQKDVGKNIAKQGYYILEKTEVISKYTEWGKRKRQRYRQLGINPLQYHVPSLSFDFLSQLPRVLGTNDLYTVPLGHGDCAIFDGKIFPSPYLKLNGLDSDAIVIPIRIKKGFRNLVDSLSVHWNEQTFLRALHFSGAFRSIIRKVCNIERYELGPSGHISSSFPFWMKDARRNKLVRLVYDGVVDLDECLYPKCRNVVLPIEAKIDDEHHGLSWHKLAFPAYRFIDNSKAMRIFRTGSSIRGIYGRVRIVPVYCLYRPTIKRAYLYVFPQIVTNRYLNYDRPEYGIILNERKKMVPDMIFEVRLNWL
jgi:hypothetical protein